MIALHSRADDRAISKNLLRSAGEDFPEPSAILSGTESDARLSWSPRWAKPLGSLSIRVKAVARNSMEH